MDSTGSEPKGWLEVLGLKRAEEIRSGKEPETAVDAALRVQGVGDEREEVAVGVPPCVVNASFEGDALLVEEGQGTVSCCEAFSPQRFSDGQPLGLLRDVLGRCS